jgi:hypothetical protein
MSLTLYTEDAMETSQTDLKGTFRDTETSLAQAADAMASAAAAIGRTADAATSILLRVDRQAANAEAFVATYLKKLTPILDELLKLLP